MLTESQKVNALRKHLQQECGCTPTTKWVKAHLEEFCFDENKVVAISSCYGKSEYSESDQIKESNQKKDYVMQMNILYCNLTVKDSYTSFLRALKIFLYFSGKVKSLEIKLSFVQIQEKLSKIYPALVPKNIRQLQISARKKVLIAQYRFILSKLKAFYAYYKSPQNIQLSLF